MGMRKIYSFARFFVSLTVMSVLVFWNVFSVPFSPLPFGPKVAEAAQASIDTTANSNGSMQLHAGPQTVFTSDQTGYKFYVDSGGDCVYSKTTNGGTSWNTPVQIDSQTDCIGIAVWYDKWTPNDTGTTIHIATIDSSSNNDNIFYNALDTTTDTRLTGAAAINTDPGNVQTYTLVAGANYPSITKATNGTLYVSVDDRTDSAVLRCSTTCGTGTNWTEAGTSPQDAQNDFSILVPLVSGNVMIINRDISAGVIRSKIWYNSISAWTTAWTTIDAAATDNGTYPVGLSATISTSTSAATSTVYLAYTADNTTLGTDDDVRVGVYSNSSWSTVTPVLNDAKGITSASIGRDENSGSIYLAYTARTTPGTASTGNVYWKVSTSSISSWSAEQGPINTSSNDMYGVDLNARNNHRIYATWYGSTGATVFGNTVADLTYGVMVSTTKSQNTEVSAPKTNYYIGGVFSLQEQVSSRNVTGITIGENGTINGTSSVANIKLYYEMDNTYPYDCASVQYDGGGAESQFGGTDANGFSGADGISSFTGSSVTVSTTSAMCVYVVMDILDAAVDGATLNVYVPTPSTGVTVTDGGEVTPTTDLDMSSFTTVRNDYLVQTGYHWRNDDNTELLATSKTGGIENTALSALQQGSQARLRVQISNTGGTTSPSSQFRLEYSRATTTCSAAYLWTDVGSTTDDWDMYDSIHLTDNDSTNDIGTSTGGVTNPIGKTFLTTNYGVKDASSTATAVTLTSSQYTELEYSVVPTAFATEGNTYCFRVTNAGTTLQSYSQYPRATISADVNVSATGTAATSKDIPTSNVYFGGAYVIKENTSSRSVTSITLTENGTVDAQNDLSNIRIKYDLDTSNPYDCGSESYSGSELQYGATSSSFSSANGTSTFTGSVSITTTQTLCLYVVADINETANNGDTVNIVVNNPSNDVVVSGGGSVSPSATQDITGSTTLAGAILSQTHYHWRNNDGGESTSTSATLGVEDTPLDSLPTDTPIRLRLQVSNSGSTSTPSTAYRLMYGAKVTTCSAVGTWTDVGSATDAFDMYNTINLTDGNNTTDIGTSTGGVSNPGGKTLLSSNFGVKDTSSLVASTSLTTSQFTELEFSIVSSSTFAGFDVPYCFKVVKGTGSDLDTYSSYAELTTAPKRDFKVQRNFVTIPAFASSATITAGSNYDAPSASTSAFIRITNSSQTGAGNSTGGGNQNADDATAYISDPSNIKNSITFVRSSTANTETRVYWEIVEYIGSAGGDNEIIVRDQKTLTYGTTATQATGTPSAGVVDDADIVVFITGQGSPDTTRTNYESLQSTSAWDSATDQPAFTRGDHGNDAVTVSYAVIEFIGLNWQIQRVEHAYAAAGITETENITLVNDRAHTFLHTQKRVGAGLNGVDEFGAQVTLSSVGVVSFWLEPGAGTTTGQTSVAWVIENLQTGTGQMLVTRSGADITGGTSPLTVSIPIETTVDGVDNTSIFVNDSSSGTGTTFPQPIVGAMISSTTHYILWRSDTGSTLTYKTEVVEWPVLALTYQQNYYRLYVDSNDITPTDPWPVGGTADLGENTALTAADEPLKEGDVIRIRMSLIVKNATMPSLTQAFRLQYAARDTTCSAVASSGWYTLGDTSSSTIWRGYNSGGITDGATISPLTLSPSDVGGTIEETNDSAVNPNSADELQDVEYDWVVEQNGALGETTYCFRMVRNDGTELQAYNYYPQIRTASFNPATQNWRWYGDEGSETPATSLASENTSPIDVVNQDVIKLRVTVKELNNIGRDDIRFKLQYDETANFSDPIDVVASSTCTATSTWCYSDGGGADNGVISSSTLSDADSCIAGVGTGCGTHNESSVYLTGFRQEGSAATEYEFTIRHAGARVGAVYYFRLYSLTHSIPVPTNSGETYPSLITQGGDLMFTLTGVATSTVVEGVTTDVGTTPTTIPFGDFLGNATKTAAYQLEVNTNSTEGYSVFLYTRAGLLSASGDQIDPITASNTAPQAWDSACIGSSLGCFGYHAGDDTLSGGSTRFAPDNTFAALESTPREVAHADIPIDDIVTTIYRIRIKDGQPAGIYETNLVYIVVPFF